MKSFAPITYVTSEQFDTAIAFAESLSNSFYKNRGQLDQRKLDMDQIAGAIAEQVVADLFGGTPDFNVYNVSQKSFAPDLELSDGRQIEVKSCYAYSRCRPSWVFQRESRFVTRPDEAWHLATVIVEPETFDRVVVITPEPLQAIKLVGLYERLELDHLNRTKRALYLRRLLHEGLPCYRAPASMRWRGNRADSIQSSELMDLQI